MEANDDKADNELADATPAAVASSVAASSIAGAIAGVTDPKVKSDPTKEKIPPANIIEMLTRPDLRKEVMPLLESVLDIISKIDGLDTAINDVFKTKTGDNKKLGEALKMLQDKLRSIYTRTYTTGGKRRKSKKRNYYKKRRTSKYR
jgi:hypothetical protein